MEAKQKSIINLKSCLLSNCLLEKCNWTLQRRASTCGTEKAWQGRDFILGGESCMAGTQPLWWEQGYCGGRAHLATHEDTSWRLFWNHVNCPLVWYRLRASCTRSCPSWLNKTLPPPASQPLSSALCWRGWQMRNEACRDQLQHPKLGKKGACRIWRPNLVTDTFPKIYGVKKIFLGFMGSIHEPAAFTGL